MHPNMDFVAHAQFMWYGGDWVPRHLVFVAVYDSKEKYCVQPAKESLTGFTYKDIQKNIQLVPNNPFEEIPDDETLFPVPVLELPKYLSRDFYENILNCNGWAGATVGTVDMATFMYLEPLFPEGTVQYLGPKVMKDSVHMMGRNADANGIAVAAAEQVFLARQSTNDPYWEL